MTTSNDQLSGWTEKKLRSTSQSQTYTKKRSWSNTKKKKRSQSQFGGLLPVWSITTFWIMVKPLHLRSMFSKLIRCTENCQRLQAALVNWKGPILHDTRPHAAQAVLQKLNQLGYEVLPYLPYSPNLSPTDYNFFKHLDNILQGKCFPQEFV